MSTLFGVLFLHGKDIQSSIVLRMRDGNILVAYPIPRQFIVSPTRNVAGTAGSRLFVMSLVSKVSNMSSVLFGSDHLSAIILRKPDVHREASLASCFMRASCQSKIGTTIRSYNS